MVESVDAEDLKSSAQKAWGGSSPARGTKLLNSSLEITMFRTLILSAALLFSSFPAYAQVERETSGSLGGTIINDDNIVLTGGFKHVTDTGPREYSFESDIL